MRCCSETASSMDLALCYEMVGEGGWGRCRPSEETPRARGGRMERNQFVAEDQQEQQRWDDSHQGDESGRSAARRTPARRMHLEKTDLYSWGQNA